MPNPLADEAKREAFLATPRLAILMTNREDPAPIGVPVWFEWNGTTVEMFAGADPHPSDDIYALGCITYELLTGKHPYARRPAPQAQSKGLRPPSVAKLDKRQQKGLAAAVALSVSSSSVMPGSIGSIRAVVGM